MIFLFIPSLSTVSSISITKQFMGILWILIKVENTPIWCR